ncbi:RtcB family protein [Gottfriedia acidiceleris]|uniref:RtcB family protein n=1 Tax=Gottfriedia acidiceleris TaxID=371036 RepID=UPI00339B0533
MIEFTGKYNTAKVFTDNVESTAASQIIELCNQEFTKGSQIRIMPDTHAGAGCTIGTTMTITDKIVANLVGVDIGCGMAVVKVQPKEEINFDKLDEVVRKYVPSGFSIRSNPHVLSKKIAFNEVRAPINIHRAERSIGTLGGGNHFIELNQGEDGSIYLVIHSGSRNLGKQVAEYYQKLAYDRLMDAKSQKDLLIAQLKAEGRESDIQEALKSIGTPKIKKELAYLEGQGFADYMHDMKIAQMYALYNRYAMTQEIIDHMGWTVLERFDTIHNYIDMDNMILRKGAISAQKGEKVIVPLNMRDGSIIAYGKGNPDWNYSGPHGAGRLMSRSKAKEMVSLEEYQTTMKDVWSTSVVKETLDESPMAYKPMEEIILHTKDTLDISDIIKPLYNFKAH